MPWKGSTTELETEYAKVVEERDDLQARLRATARQMKDALERIRRLENEVADVEPRLKDAEGRALAAVLALRSVVFEGLTANNDLVPSERLVISLVRAKELCAKANLAEGWLSPEVVRRLRSAFAFNQPWPITEVLEKLADASDILLRDKDYDGHGWELIQSCVPRARIMAATFRQIYVDFLRNA